MLTVEGVFKNGQVQLLADVPEIDESRVLVTFVENADLRLDDLGIDKAVAAELRATFEAFEDWNDPAMDVYNDYDNAQSTLD